MTLLYLLFFCSGVSGLVYQVVWVREFGNAFGNTIQSASIVVAIFMLGLGAGSYAVGRWADRRYQSSPDSLLRVYGVVELLIAALGLAVSLVLPHLGSIIAALSSYSTGANGWHVLTLWSYIARGLVAVLLLAPITLLMGGTLTLLIRFVVRADLAASGWKIALLYAVNTAGAAGGAFATDFALVPAAGLLVTQMAAVGLNVIAGTGALLLAARRRPGQPGAEPESGSRKAKRPAGQRPAAAALSEEAPGRAPVVTWTSVALALSGFAAMGLEILWLRHVNVLLGGFRAVFSLLMTVLLVGIGAGALAGGWLDRRLRRPAEALMMVQALFAIAALLGIASADEAALSQSEIALGATMASLSPMSRALTELWFNTKPMLLEIGLPSLLAGFSFPLGNALVQRTERVVGRRAGALYLANTCGAVVGSLVTGYVLLPFLGVQAGAAILVAAVGAGIVALYLASRRRGAFVVAGVATVGALAAWMMLPGDYVLQRSLTPEPAGERVVAVSEGATELIEVVEAPGKGRGLMTNGHAMSSTAPLDQRYMRALAHIPLLSMERPERVLVIGFGVGNSTNAATLHPSVRQVDVADLSRHILEHASYFSDANHDALKNPKVSVYVNDGRQHLRMTPEGTYDLVTLEPPPIAYAGVAALYSREFYQLARSRLKAGGYISQWLPAYQVPPDSTLAMVRAFIDVFPQAVLLSGMQAELLLIGTTGPRIEIDPARLETALKNAPAVRDDLARLDLGTPREIVGTFVGSATTLARATDGSPAVTDDKPLQEYGVRSTLATASLGVPASVFDLDEVDQWCPRCFADDRVATSVENLDVYLALLDIAYKIDPAEVAASAASSSGRRVMGSAYLGAIVPDTTPTRQLLAVPYQREGGLLLAERRFAEAEQQLRAALDLSPDSAEAHNDLGVVLASTGRVAEARQHFARAVQIRPGFAEARDNLARAGG